MHFDTNEHAVRAHDAAAAAQRRAEDARRRAVAARHAAEQATTEYTRLALRRVADLHAELALSHEDLARTLGAADGVAPGE
jgi:hypothetical protein